MITSDRIFLFRPDPDTHTATAMRNLSKIYETGKLRSLTLAEFEVIERSVYSLLRDGKAEITMTNAAHWFKKAGFKIEFDGVNFVVRESGAKIPGYYQKLERIFADKMAAKYKTSSAFAERHPNNSLKISGIVLSGMNVNFKQDVFKILKDKGARDPLSTVAVLDKMIYESFRRNEKSAPSHTPKQPFLGASD
jgi:hypothetical protein